MAYVIYPLFAVVSFVANILAWLLCFPMAALSVATGKDVSPWPLSLLHTADDTLDGGEHQLGWPVVTGWRLVLQRTIWIARNPGGGVDNYWLGIPRGPETIVTLERQVAELGQPGFVQVHSLVYRGRRYFSYKSNHFFLGWNPSGVLPDIHTFKFSIRND